MGDWESIAPAADAVAEEIERQQEATADHEELSEAEGAVYGLLGATLGHSWSPRIHSDLGTAPYGLFAFPDASEAEAFVRGGAWKGLNVTIPYKRLAAEAADVRTPLVEGLGAANTLVRLPDGHVMAENTDVWGFEHLLTSFCEKSVAGGVEALRGRKALVLGSGGAHEAVRHVLEGAGMEVVRVSRDPSRGTPYEGLAERHGDAALLVNTTPVGMYPHCPATPLPEGELEGLRSLVGVLDIVYNPRRTQLLAEAERLGIPCEGGLPMLVAQAFRSSELWQGRRLDPDLIERIVGALHKERGNVFFIGMPGCGKTGAARRLARLTQRPFVDLDDAFEMDHGETPAACIEREGEATFRAKESEVVRRYGAGSGLVVACGGGVVTREENYLPLHQNGTIVMLDRPLDQLARTNRPLTAAKGVEALAAERLPLYRSWADIEVACTGSAEGDATLVKTMLGL